MTEEQARSDAEALAIAMALPFMSRAAAKAVYRRCKCRRRTVRMSPPSPRRAAGTLRGFCKKRGGGPREQRLLEHHIDEEKDEFFEISRKTFERHDLKMNRRNRRGIWRISDL